MPVSLTVISRCEFTRSSSTWTRPSFGVNLMALAKVPDHLLQPARVARNLAARGSRIRWMRMPLASAAGSTVSIATWMTAVEVHRLHVEAELAGDDAGDIEQIVDQLRLELHVSLDRLRPSADLLVGVGVPRAAPACSREWRSGACAARGRRVARNSSFSRLAVSASPRPVRPAR